MDIMIGTAAAETTFTNAIVATSRQKVANTFTLLDGTKKIQEAPSVKRLFDVILVRPTAGEIIDIENEYDKAIRKYEKDIEPVLETMDFERALLYKGKLKTIDNQIGECRDELKRNPGSGRIRRYMLAALRDKKETLAEIARYCNENA